MMSAKGLKRVRAREGAWGACDLKGRRVGVRERKPRCAVAHGRCVECVISRTKPLNGTWGLVQSPMESRLLWVCRLAQDDLSGTFTNVIGAIFCSGDAKGSGLCSVKLLSDGGCRSGTQGRRLDDVGGSTARGCGNCCDSGSDVEKGVTLIKTRLLRKRSEQWLWYHVKNTEWIILYFSIKEYTVSLYKRYMCTVQVQVCYISNLTGPKVHNIIHVNRPKVHNIIHVNK